jgi:hypothetical protein
MAESQPYNPTAPFRASGPILVVKPAFEFLDLSDAIGPFDWTLDSVKPMHHALRRLMTRECDFIESLSDAPRWAAPVESEIDGFLASCHLDC